MERCKHILTKGKYAGLQCPVIPTKSNYCFNHKRYYENDENYKPRISKRIILENEKKELKKLREAIESNQDDAPTNYV